MEFKKAILKSMFKEPFPLTLLVASFLTVFIIAPVYAGLSVGSGSTLSLGSSTLKMNCQDIIISNGATVSVQAGEIQDCRDLTIESSAILTSISGDISMNGTFTLNGTIDMGSGVIQPTQACGQTNLLAGSGDFDSDGIDNNTDSDNDNDGMPDQWEIDNGLNFLLDDSQGDPDGDGYTNLQEYNAGSSPNDYNDKLAPEKPIPLSPSDGETGVSLTPELTTEPFNDADTGDTHEKSQWQISTESDFSTLTLDVTTSDHLTALSLPTSMLTEETVYFWRVRFYDSTLTASAWSDTVTFTTAEDATDANENGIPDDQEVDAAVDLDGDGASDNTQTDMKCVNIWDGEHQIGVKISTNCTCIDSLEWIDPDTIPETDNRPGALPLGLISFKVQVAHPGDTAQVIVYLPMSMPEGVTWYKYDTINGWQHFTANALFSLDRASLTLTLTDGGAGDADGAVNGYIVDPSGLSTDSVQGGGGCFIATAAYGSSMEPEVKVLRAFRDTYLLTNSAGKAVVRLYYSFSPPVAHALANHEGLRGLVRWGLLPVVGMSWVALKLGPFSSIGLIIFFFMGLTGIAGLRRRKKKR